MKKTEIKTAKVSPSEIWLADHEAVVNSKKRFGIADRMALGTIDISVDEATGEYRIVESTEKQNIEQEQTKWYDGIPTGKKYNQYSKDELAKLPPIPEVKAGVDYPAHYKEPPLYWVGYRWQLIFE